MRNANYEAMHEANAVSHREIKPKKILRYLQLTPVHVSKVHNADGEKMHVVEHNFGNDGPGPYIKPEEHHFATSEGEKLIDHVREHMKIKEPAAAGEKEAETSEKGTAASAAE